MVRNMRTQRNLNGLSSRKCKALHMGASCRNGGMVVRLLKATLKKEDESRGTFKELLTSAPGMAQQIQIPKSLRHKVNARPPASSFSQMFTDPHYKKCNVRFHWSKVQKLTQKIITGDTQGEDKSIWENDYSEIQSLEIVIRRGTRELGGPGGLLAVLYFYTVIHEIDV